MENNLDTFIFHGDWIDNIEALPQDMQDKILSDMVRYGCRRETSYDDDPIVSSFVNMVKRSIDGTINSYLQKKNMSQTAGRKKKINDEYVYNLAREGKTAQEIADEIGCSKSAIDKSDGWRNRKNDDFVF